MSNRAVTLLLLTFTLILLRLVTLWHAGASSISLAPTYFISQSAHGPLLLMFNGSDDMCVKLRKVAKRHFFEVSKLFLTGKGFVILVGGRFICETALRRCVFAVIPLQTGALDVIVNLA